MAENVSIVSITSSDEEMLKIVEMTANENMTELSKKIEKESRKTPAIFSPINESTPKKYVELQPLKILNLSWDSQSDNTIEWDQHIMISNDSKVSSPEAARRSQGDKSLEWDQAVVIASINNSQVELTSPETLRNKLIGRLNFLLAIRGGLNIAMTQLATELVEIEKEIQRISTELNIENWV